MKRRFFIICRDVVEDKSLSLQSLGLYVWMMGQSDDCEFNIKSLSALTGKSTKIINACLRELISKSYCLVKQDENGKIAYEFDDKNTCSYPKSQCF
jgi:hypothetical protein